MAYISCYQCTDLEMILNQFIKENLRFNNKIPIPANIRREIVGLVSSQDEMTYFSWDWATTQYHTLPTYIHKYGFSIFVSRLIQIGYFYSEYSDILCMKFSGKEVSSSSKQIHPDSPA